MTNTRGVDFSEQGDYLATRGKALKQATIASQIHYDVAGVTLVFVASPLDNPCLRAC